MSKSSVKELSKRENDPPKPVGTNWSPEKPNIKVDIKSLKYKFKNLIDSQTKKRIEDLRLTRLKNDKYENEIEQKQADKMNLEEKEKKPFKKKETYTLNGLNYTEYSVRAMVSADPSPTTMATYTEDIRNSDEWKTESDSEITKEKSLNFILKELVKIFSFKNYSKFLFKMNFKILPRRVHRLTTNYQKKTSSACNLIMILKIKLKQYLQV